MISARGGRWRYQFAPRDPRIDRGPDTSMIRQPADHDQETSAKNRPLTECGCALPDHRRGRRVGGDRRAGRRLEVPRPARIVAGRWAGSVSHDRANSAPSEAADGRRQGAGACRGGGYWRGGGEARGRVWSRQPARWVPRRARRCAPPAASVARDAVDVGCNLLAIGAGGRSAVQPGDSSGWLRKSSRRQLVDRLLAIVLRRTLLAGRRPCGQLTRNLSFPRQ